MAMTLDTTLSTADNDWSAWRELIGLKDAAALNGCKGFVVERDASTGRYLFQVVEPSWDAARTKRCGPWAL